MGLPRLRYFLVPRSLFATSRYPPTAGSFLPPPRSLFGMATKLMRAILASSPALLRASRSGLVSSRHGTWRIFGSYRVGNAILTPLALQSNSRRCVGLVLLPLHLKLMQTHQQAYLPRVTTQVPLSQVRLRCSRPSRTKSALQFLKHSPSDHLGLLT